MQVKLQSQPKPLPGQLPQYAVALDAVRKVRAFPAYLVMPGTVPDTLQDNALDSFS